jgi:DNA-directed RNA polymerase subunit K/omega
MSKNALLSMALRQADNRFLLVNLLTKRIWELRDGARPLFHGANNLSIDEIALREIAEGKITPISIIDT